MPQWHQQMCGGLRYQGKGAAGGTDRSLWQERKPKAACSKVRLAFITRVLGSQGRL